MIRLGLTEDGQLRERDLREGSDDGVGSEAVEVDLGEAPPEAAPLAGEAAGVGGGAGAAGAGEDLEECVVGEAADAVRLVGVASRAAAPLTASAASFVGRLRGDGAARA
jgi:hypothetical protein